MRSCSMQEGAWCKQEFAEAAGQPVRAATASVNASWTMHRFQAAVLAWLCSNLLQSRLRNEAHCVNPELHSMLQVHPGRGAAGAAAAAGVPGHRGGRLAADRLHAAAGAPPRGAGVFLECVISDSWHTTCLAQFEHSHAWLQLQLTAWCAQPPASFRVWLNAHHAPERQS